MSHLSPSEFVDLADGTLPAVRAAHLERCAGCRAQADTVTDALHAASGSAPVPEPSALYWTQFSARVREAVSQTPQRSIFGWRVARLQPVAAAVVAGVLLFSGVFLLRNAGPEGGAPSAQTSAPGAHTDHPYDPALDPNHAAEWAVLTAAAADLHIDEARDAGMAVPSGTVDQAVTQLTRDELSELGRLLQSELKRSSN